VGREVLGHRGHGQEGETTVDKLMTVLDLVIFEMSDQRQIDSSWGCRKGKE